MNSVSPLYSHRVINYECNPIYQALSGSSGKDRRGEKTATTETNPEAIERHFKDPKRCMLDDKSILSYLFGWQKRLICHASNPFSKVSVAAEKVLWHGSMHKERAY